MLVKRSTALKSPKIHCVFLKTVLSKSFWVQVSVLKMPASHTGASGFQSSFLLISPAHHRRQGVMAQVRGPLPRMWEFWGIQNRKTPPWPARQVLQCSLLLTWSHQNMWSSFNSMQLNQWESRKIGDLKIKSSEVFQVKPSTFFFIQNEIKIFFFNKKWNSVFYSTNLDFGHLNFTMLCTCTKPVSW